MNIYDEISRVAYEIWVKKGMPEGNDLENWLEAEQIVYASLRGSDETKEASDVSIETNEVSVTTITPLEIPDTENEKTKSVSEEGKPKKKTTKTKKSASTTTSSKSKSKKTTTTKKKA